MEFGQESDLLGVAVKSKIFAQDASRKILTDIDLHVAQGEIVAILGPSGSGKTTLLRIIAGLDSDFDGQISCRGESVAGPSANRGLVFQDSRLLPWLTVRENIAFGLPSAMASNQHARVDELLDLVGLSEFADVWPRELSGGMEKRAALARALVGSPDLLMLDEPFGALDLESRLILQGELVSLNKQFGFGVLLVTHDLDEAVYLADRIVILGGAPTSFHHELPISLERPRDRLSDAFAAARAQVLAHIIGSEHSC